MGGYDCERMVRWGGAGCGESQSYLLCGECMFRRFHFRPLVGRFGGGQQALGGLHSGRVLWGMYRLGE